MQLGSVTLRVRALTQVVGFYRDDVGLSDKGDGDLGALKLLEAPKAPFPDPRSPGLFHTAFLYPSRASLAAAVLRAARSESGSEFQGSADHGVSEAFYFADPDGNGVELYFDKPKAEWPMRNGKIEMVTDLLSPDAYLERHLTDGAPEAPVLGHIHLKVSDLGEANSFLIGQLGMDLIQEMPGAIFASWNGYHHHFGANTWHSRGAEPKPTGSLGLAGYRLIGAGAKEFRDPWGAEVTIAPG